MDYEEFEMPIKRVNLEKGEKERAKEKPDDEFNRVSNLVTTEKTVEQFRQEIISDIFQAIKRETNRSISFVKRADYVRAKFCEYKIEGLHKAVSIMLDAITINVREE